MGKRNRANITPAINPNSNASSGKINIQIKNVVMPKKIPRNNDNKIFVFICHPPFIYFTSFFIIPHSHP